MDRQTNQGQGRERTESERERERERKRVARARERWRERGRERERARQTHRSLHVVHEADTNMYRLYRFERVRSDSDVPAAFFLQDISLSSLAAGSGSGS